MRLMVSPSVTAGAAGVRGAIGRQIGGALFQNSLYSGATSPKLDTSEGTRVVAVSCGAAGAPIGRAPTTAVVSKSTTRPANKLSTRCLFMGCPPQVGMQP